MKYKPFTYKAASELAAPPTWVASIGPCFIAGALAVCCALAYAFESGATQALGTLAQLAVVLDGRSLLCWVLMLLCAVLMQSAINTLNDYQDFKSGLDTADTVLDETDASLVYNQINPRSALLFALVLLALAALLGAIVVWLSTPVLLLLGLVSAAVLALYSAGPKPISSLPLGELTSGVVMGGVLTCASFYAVTLSFSYLVVAVAFVPTVSVAQIMLTNNTCDIERDLIAGRKTLPGIIGLQTARTLNAAFCFVTFVWLAVVLVWAELFFGLIFVVAGFMLCLPKILRMLKEPYDLKNRRVMMRTVVSYNKGLHAAAVLALILGGAINAFV